MVTHRTLSYCTVIGRLEADFFGERLGFRRGESIFGTTYKRYYKNRVMHPPHLHSRRVISKELLSLGSDY